LPLSGIEANILPSDGDTTSMRRPDAASCDRPSMKFAKARPSATLREKCVFIVPAPLCGARAL
jgi:hypothetical protein